MKKNYQYENSRGTPSDAKYSVYKFQKNPCSHLLEHAWTKSCPQMGVRQTDRQADGQSNRQSEPNIPLELRLRGYNYGRGTCESPLTKILYIVYYS